MKAHYKEGYEALDEEYAKKTTRQKYVKVPEYVDFKSVIWVRICNLFPCLHAAYTDPLSPSPLNVPYG